MNINNSLFSINPNMGNIVSNYYYHVDGNATTGLIADFISRFSLFGCYFFVIIIPLYLLFIKKITENIKFSFQFLLFGNLIYLINNTSLLTIQITYGTIFTIILVIISQSSLQKK